MRHPTELPAFLAELSWRGLLQDRTAGLEARLARGPISAYVGFDPTGPSLHVGHLVQVFLLTHLQRAGGRPVVLIGGGTGMIGDPAGKSAERNLLDDDTLEANRARFRRQLEGFIDFSAGATGAVMLDNREWLARWSMLEFLRDVGKHFTVAYMLAKESVQQRMTAGLSFTEFSYMTLQAADFLHLYREHGVEMQMGGADQWGNITAGLELIRRVEGRAEGEEPPAHALCSPLLVVPGGQKMGKTEQGAVYLDPELTRPYDFYQYLLNQPDPMVSTLLRWLTLLEHETIEALEAEQAMHPERRPGQRAFAFDLTARVHGAPVAERQVRVADVAFGTGGPVEDPRVLAELFEELGGFEVGPETLGGGALAVALASGLYASSSEARRAIGQGGLTINDRRVVDREAAVIPIAGEWLVVRAGKKRLAVGRVRN